MPGPIDPYTWRAYYDDGTTLDEEPEDGSRRNAFADIDQSRLVALEIIPVREGFHGFVQRIDRARGQRLILFRRRAIRLSMETGEQEHEPSVMCVGWQRTVGGENVSSYTWFFPDGSSLNTDADVV